MLHLSWPQVLPVRAERQPCDFSETVAGLLCLQELWLLLEKLLMWSALVWRHFWRHSWRIADRFSDASTCAGGTSNCCIWGCAGVEGDNKRCRSQVLQPPRVDEGGHVGKLVMRPYGRQPLTCM